MQYDDVNPTGADTPRTVPGSAASWPRPEAQNAWAPDEGEREFHVTDLLQVVWTHRWISLGILLATLLLAVAWSFTQPKLYQAQAKIGIQAAGQQIIKGQLNTGPSFWELERYINDQIQVLRSREIAQRAAERLGLTSGPDSGAGAATDMLLGMLGASSLKGTNIILVSMVGSDPERVSQWLNVYVQAYVEANIEDGLRRTQQVYDVILSRLDPLREQLEDSESRLLQFKEDQDAVLFSDQDKNIISEQVNTLTSAYAETRADRIRLETKLNALRRLRSSSLAEASFSEVLGDSLIRELRAQRGEFAAELTDKLRTYKEDHPVIRDLRSRIAGIDARLLDQIDTLVTSTQTDYEIALGREQSLYNNIQQLKEQSIALSKSSMEYEKLRREYEQNKSFLEGMLARSKEVDISSTLAMNNIRIIDPAIAPRGPFSPNIPRNLMVGLIVGLMMAFGSALGLDYMDRTIRVPDQVERYLGLDVLAAVPRFKEDSVRVLRESFQSLRTALLLAARQEGGQVVMVTSATPEEGKTTIAFNLAKVLASGGERVVLIDADLRRPRLHRLINAKNVRGLTSLVLGEREIRDVIHALSEVPNLDLVTSGPLPPNPPELFGKASFKALLERLRMEYDWVIIDSAPVASVTDPVICSRVVDMVLLVIEYGGTRREIIRDALRNLSRSGVRVAGAVLNKVDLQRSYYYYSAYYAYSKYYQEDTPDAKGSSSTEARA